MGRALGCEARSRALGWDCDLIESVRPWTDESLQNRVQKKEGDFAVLRDTAAEIIYIVRSSFNDLAASRPDIH